MAEDLDLSVPDAGGRHSRSGGGGGAVTNMLLVILVLLAAAALYLQLGGAPKSLAPAAAGAESEKKLALKLEEKDLYNAAIEAWERYVSSARLRDEERAKIYWRLGNLYMKAERFEEAVGAYYRCEAAFRLADVENELARRVKRCLDRLGKFSAAGRELAGRTTGAESGAEDVVAEIGQQKITLADLESEMERQADAALKASPYAVGEAGTRMRERILKEMSSTDAKMQMLDTMVIEEVLYRKAVDDGLAKGDDFRRMLSRLEKRVLAGKVMEKEMTDNIKIGESDLKNYYEAHKSDFTEKEKDSEEVKQLPYEEVREKVAKALVEQKQREVQARLFAGLREKYGVVMHPSKLK
jgi:tetratricopeptide (TPR) repeat protein